MERIDSRRLGAHLLRLRLERKLSLGAVESLSIGHGARINKTYLFRVERGKTVPTIPRLRVLAKVYRVRLGTLLEVLEGALAEQERGAETGAESDIDQSSFEELRSRGIDAEREGDFLKAAVFYRAARDRAISEPPSPKQMVNVALTRHDLSIALKEAGHLDLAKEEAEAAIEIEDLPQNVVDKLRLNLAATYRKLGRPFIAKELLTLLLARRDEVSVETLAGAHWVMGSVLLDRQPTEAARHYRSALSIIRSKKDSYDECRILYNIGLAESRAGNYVRALKPLTKACDLAKRKDYNFWVAKILTEIGKTLFLRGDRELARKTLREANEQARRRDYWEQLFINQYYLRRFALDEGDVASAKAAESSLKFFTTRIEDSFEELQAFKEETE